MDAIGLEIKEDRWEASLLKKTLFDIVVAERVAFKGEDAQRAQGLADFIRDKRLKSPRISVCLQRGASFSRTLSLNVPAEGLEAAVRHESERHVPAAGAVESGFAVIGKNRGEYIVLFAAASQGAAHAAIDALSLKGLRPYMVSPWQPCLYGALQTVGLMDKKAGRRAFVIVEEDQAFIEAFDSRFPVYSKCVRANGKMELLAAIEKEVGLMASSLGAFEDCALISKGIGPDGLRSFESVFSKVKALDLDDRMMPSPSVGAALSALGVSSYAIDLMKPEGKARRTIRNTHTALLGAGVLSMAVLLWGAVLAKDWYVLRSIEKASSAVSVEKERISALERSVKTTASRVEALNRIKSSGPIHTLDVMKKLSGTLPGGAWITGFESSGGIVTIEGFAERPSSLVLMMERSGEFSGIELAGPVTAGKGSKDGFRLKFRPGPVQKPI